MADYPDATGRVRAVIGCGTVTLRTKNMETPKQRKQRLTDIKAFLEKHHIPYRTKTSGGIDCIGVKYRGQYIDISGYSLEYIKTNIVFLENNT
jgi:Mn-containing catalase